VPPQTWDLPALIRVIQIPKQDFELEEFHRDVANKKESIPGGFEDNEDREKCDRNLTAFLIQGEPRRKRLGDWPIDEKFALEHQKNVVWALRETLH